MHAVIVTGGKQYRVAAGDVIQIEKLSLEPGAKTEFPVIFLSDGDKVVSGKDAEALKAKAEVMELIKAPKIIVYKYKAKKNVRKKQGHRQRYTKVKIVSIG